MERVLITGGASGIGAACAARAREDGYEPIVIDRVGGDITADLSDPEATAKALATALEGGPDHATRQQCRRGCAPPRSEDQTLDDLDATVQLNLRCAMQCAQALFAGDEGGGGLGRIVNIASRAALGKELRTAYARDQRPP